MRGGGILIFFAFWIAAALWAYAKTKNRSEDATQTALYLVCYPAAMVLAFVNKPVSAVIMLPLVIAGVPWLFAGIHLSKVLKSPLETKPGEFVGISAKIWLWGLGLSIALPVLLGA